MFFYDGNTIHISNFISIKYVDNEVIVIELINKNIVLKGINLLIVELSDDEMYIQGVIQRIDIKDV